MVVKQEQYNIGHFCTKQQCDKGLGDKTASRWIPVNDKPFDITFSNLNIQSNKFANVLSNLGFCSGDILFTFLPKCPEQFFTFLGTLKLEALCGTLLSNFGGEAQTDRLGPLKVHSLRKVS